MLRSVLLIVLALVLLNLLQPWLAKIGLGRLPGDLHFKVRGRPWSLPIASALLLSLLLTALGRVL